jgi:hypothetical protein
MEELDEILEEYAYESEIFSASYELMGQMLDREYVKNRLEMLELFDVYIYGGGYLGIQLYNAINLFVNISGVVDKSGKLLLEISDIPIIDLNEFRSQYRQQRVIITPIKHYKSIYKELSEFVPKDKILYLGEFLGGIL